MKRSFLAALLPLLLGVAGLSATYAQTYRWHRIPTPPGPINQEITFLAVNARGDIFAGTNGDFFRSTDDGGSWVRMDTLVSSHAIEGLAADREGRIYIGTYEEGIFRSTDRGATWHKASMGYPVGAYNGPLVALGDTVIAQSDEGSLFRSINAGEEWSRVDSFPARATSFTTAGNGIIFACSRAGLFRSTDAGLTWHGALPGFPCITITPHGMYCGDAWSTIIHVSTDNGNHWQPLARHLPAHSCSLLGSDSGGTLIAGTDSGLLRSTDRGVTWRRVAGGKRDGFFKSFAATPRDHLFIGTEADGIWRSIDHGITWRKSNGGLVPDVRDIAVDPANRLFTTITGSGLFVSANRGKQWRRCRMGRRYRDASFVEIAPNGMIYAVIDRTRLMRSADGGGKWESVFRGKAEIDELRIDRGNRIFITLDDHVVMRSVGGRRWDTIAVTTEDNYVSWMAASPWGSLFLWTTHDVRRSTDHGNNWTTLHRPEEIGRGDGIVFMPSRTIILGSDVGDTIVRSSDNGETWEPLPTGYGNGITVYIHDRQGTLIGGREHGQLIGSDDTGRTWRPISNGFERVWINGVRADSMGNIVAATENAGVIMGRRIEDIPPGHGPHRAKHSRHTGRRRRAGNRHSRFDPIP